MVQQSSAKLWNRDLVCGACVGCVLLLTERGRLDNTTREANACARRCSRLGIPIVSSTFASTGRLFQSYQDVSRRATTGHCTHKTPGGKTVMERHALNPSATLWTEQTSNCNV